MEMPREMLDDARLRGRSEAETFDRELRDREQRQREARLTRLAWGAVDPEDPPFEQGAGSAVVWRLQQDVERLAAFHRAVLNSRAWRLIQIGRRLVGRAW